MTTIQNLIFFLNIKKTIKMKFYNSIEIKLKKFQKDSLKTVGEEIYLWNSLFAFLLLFSHKELIELSDFVPFIS